MAWNCLWQYCMILVVASQGIWGDSKATNITTTETVLMAVNPPVNPALNCPDNCLGGTCTFPDDGSAVCTDGCNDGYMGRMCDYPCMDKCSKCERDKFDVCIKCVQGYFGTKCHKCPKACGGQGCLSDGHCKKDCLASHICGDKCLPGCETCNETFGRCQKCAYNLMGENCKTSCSDSCRSVCPTQNCTSPCDRDTGRCLHGCKPGFWGEVCADQCSFGCQDKNCNQISGHCVKCKRGYHGHKCHLSCGNCKDSGCLQSSGICKKCDAGYYGHTCTQTCFNCSSNVCDRTSGHCMNVSMTTMTTFIGM
ncbi:scavenger receptor class F member 1-like [Haliotis asinina]|uniref:scavenger receptor class F member 1-like n=1 Tax=Haliotis asinina TaxID=109174 RepID=UPI0035319D63